MQSKATRSIDVRRLAGFALASLALIGCDTPAQASPAPAAAQPTIEQMAQTIHEAHLKGVTHLIDALEPLTAEQVTIRNHPPRVHMDGVKSGKEWIAFERAATSKSKSKATNVRSVDHKVAVEGGAIVIEETLLGTGPDGKPFRIPSKIAFNVRDGKIVGYDAYYDASATPAFMEQMEKEIKDEMKKP